MRFKWMLFVFVLVFSSSAISEERSMQKVIKESMQIVEQQSLAMAKKMRTKKDQLPKTFRDRTDFITCDSHWWTSGFYPGVLWYLYEYNHDPKTRKWAEYYTSRVEREKLTKDNHDIGFILTTSFGNGFRLTNNPQYQEVLITGAKSLASRFRSVCGCIQSWDLNAKSRAKGWQIPVIIDNMMNLELLVWASQHSENQPFYSMAVSHANTTLKNHFRADNSSYHVVSYDSLSGKVDIHCTAQGYSDESAWARGQAWGLYGFTYMYSQTGMKRFLEQAKKIAAFMLLHPNLPNDRVPFWDFNAPYIPKDARDASSAAIMASALIELSGFVDEPLRSQYLGAAETQIRTLSSPEYLASPGLNGNFILKHSVASFPEQLDVDAPQTYADYYYVEALIRYKRLLEKQ